MMNDMHERLPAIEAREREYLPGLLSEATDERADAKGMGASMLRRCLRTLAIVDFVLHQDIQAFQEGLSRSVRVKIRLIERYDAGESISPSYISMICYEQLFDALAAGNFELARELAGCIGGRPELEREHDHPFVHAMGYALKAFVLADREEMPVRQAALAQACRRRGYRNFAPYSDVFDAIVRHDVAAANAAIPRLVEAHQEESTGDGFFSLADDACLCVWGIGLVNLCRMHRLRVVGLPPLIPHELIMDME